MSANYYRMSLRFQKEETKKNLRKLQREVHEKTGKSVPVSRLVETIVEQFFDKQEVISLEEEKT